MRKIIFFLSLFISFFFYGQRSSIGFYFGSPIGYNFVYDHNALVGVENTQGLLNFNYNDDISFFNNIGVMSDGDLSNFEFFNGQVFGLKMNMVVTDNNNGQGVSVQAEIEYEELDFNHIVCQNGSAFFNTNPNTGLDNNNQYKIANYFWRVNYLNFPFVVKIYPTKNSFVQIGAKFGYLVKAKQSTTLATFDVDNSYIDYERLFFDQVTYDLFDSDTGVNNHGFDVNEWPFEWNLAIIGGIGYETKNAYFSLRYNLGVLEFFKELTNKDNDFFEIYNTDYTQINYNDFNVSSPVLNNNFKLQSIHFTIGYHFSSKQK